MSFITADADDYFAEIAGTGFDVLYEELNVKKEIVEIDAALAGKLLCKKATYEAFMKTGSNSKIFSRNKAFIYHLALSFYSRKWDSHWSQHHSA